MRSIIKNKRGQFEGMWIVVIFMVLLALAFLSAIGLGIVRWLSAEIKPVITDLGVVEGTNLSAAGEVTFGAIDTIVNLAPMLVGGAYFLLLIGCITLVVSYRTTANPLFIGLFFAFMVLLVLVAILFSNAYQDIYEAGDEIAQYLQDQTLLSFLILNSPWIFTVIGFVSGIFLFAGKQNETYGQGGY